MHVQKTCKAAYACLYSIGRISKYLDQSSREQLVHAFVTSRLDCNNAILAGLPRKAIAPLQRVQNSAARLICRVKKFDHITPTLKQLNWLPVSERIDFKILLQVFKCVQGTAPSHLRELCPVVSSRNLQSSSSIEVKSS